MAWVYYILLLVVQLAGLFINLLGLPGLWLMVGAVGIFAWLTRLAGYVSTTTLIVLTALALVAEVVEFLAASRGAKKAGGSKRAMAGAVVGGLLGGFFLTFVPIPIISTIVGVCLGCFLGASIVELFVKPDLHHSVRVGFGAATGRFYGIVSKVGFGLLILAISLIAAVPVGGNHASVMTSPKPAPRATTAPGSTTIPSTTATSPA